MGDLAGVSAQTYRVPAADGYDWSLPPHCRSKVQPTPVIVGGALGVAASFYFRYASALAEAGFPGGHLRLPRYRRFPSGLAARLPATITDWATLDMAGVTTWVNSAQAPRRLFMVGHSLGGILPGLMDCPYLVDAIVTVGSENVYWRHRRGRTKAVELSRAWITPPITGMFGYLPWSRFARAEDVPAGAARQMAAAMRTRGGFLDDATLPTQRFDTFHAPVLGYSIDDNSEATRESVDAMMATYPNVERRHIASADVGLDHLGHFGYFTSYAYPLWARRSPG